MNASLPRVFVCVSDGPDGSWTVQVEPEWDSAAARSYAMDSAEVPVGVRSLRVPVVPPSRRPGSTAEHAALSSGDEAALSGLLGRLAIARPGADDVRVYGRWLFECLLGPAWAEISESPAVKAAHGLELALQWPVGCSDLHSLVWEAMHDGVTPLAGLPDTLVVITRVVKTQYPAPHTISRVPRVLFATGAPLTGDVIRPGAMFMGLLRKFDADGLCVTRAVYNVSVEDLQAECQVYQPDVVHLVAHGQTQPDGSSVLMLGGEGPSSIVSADQLRQALTSGSRPPLAVALSACHSGGGFSPPGQAETVAGQEESRPWRAAPMAAALVAGGIPIVTAMAGAVSEPACRMYTTHLIDAIHQGRPLAHAAAEGRAAALAGTSQPDRQLDWAMPTIFLSSAVRPDFRPLDPTAVDRLNRIAGSLRLRMPPVFIGYHEILATIDDLFSDQLERRTGFLAIGRDGTLDRLGSTRLLQEAAFRLLRLGHVPLLLAHHSEAGFGDISPGPPRSLRAFLAELLQQAVEVTNLFGLPPPPLSSLAPEPRLAGTSAVTGSGPAGLAARAAYARAAYAGALQALSDFAEGSAELGEPSIVRLRLADDLDALAGVMAGAGEPFGPHTRTVVLADRVHNWTDALGQLLRMIKSDGLGRPERSTPVVVTAALNEGEGPKLLRFLNGQFGAPGIRLLELAALSGEEASLGFQWVLLNPWHPEQRYRRVYVAAPTTSQSDVQQILRGLDGKPTNVRLSLYQVIDAQTIGAHPNFLDHDDEEAFKRYLETHT